MQNKPSRIVIFFAILACLTVLLVIPACFYGCESQKEQPGYIYTAPVDISGDDELPFESGLSITLDDRINMTDHALVQSCQRLGLGLGNIVIKHLELREQGGQFYQFKTVHVYTGSLSENVFIQVFRDALIAWADQSILLPEVESAPPGQESWNIFIDGRKTHRLFVSPGLPPDAPEGTFIPGRPSLVIVIDDLGESLRSAKRLVSLNYPVTCAIWPYSTHAREIAELAHEHRLEIFIHQPMEPVGYPGVKPGKGVLLAAMPTEDLLAQLRASLQQVPFASGLNNHMGSLLTQDAEQMRIIAAELKSRGFIVLDSLTHPRSRFSSAGVSLGAVTYKRDLFLDVVDSKGAVLEQLRKAERMAILKGQAIVIGHPLNSTLEALEEWQRLRNPEVQIVRIRDLTPLSAKSTP